MSAAETGAERFDLYRRGGYFVQPRSRVLASGPDAERYLNGQISNSIRKAAIDAAVHATLLTPKGKLCAEVRVVRVGEQSFLVDSDRERAEALPARLDRYLIADDVELDDQSSNAWLLHVYGDLVPAAPEGGVASERLAVPGLDYYVAESEVGRLTDGFDSSREIDDQARSLLRIERGIPEWGAELDEETLPAEAGLHLRAVDFEKGCYVGQETVSRLKSVGHVNRSILGIIGESDSALEAGMALVSEGSDDQSKPVGRLTTVGWDFGLSKPVALAYVKRGSDADGTRLAVISVAGAPLGTVTVKNFPLI